MAKLSVRWLNKERTRVEVTSEYRTGFLWRKRIRRMTVLDRSDLTWWRFPNGDRANYSVPGSNMEDLDRWLDIRRASPRTDEHWTDVQALPAARVVEK